MKKHYTYFKSKEKHMARVNFRDFPIKEFVTLTTNRIKTWDMRRKDSHA